MNHAIVYESRTGNTKKLAHAVAAANPAQGPRMRQLIENFDTARDHPDEGDLAHLVAAVKEAN